MKILIMQFRLHIKVCVCMFAWESHLRKR